MQRRAAYGIAALILLVVEVLIALFVNDQFVRPYLGDVLAVVLVYASLRAVTPMGVYTGTVYCAGNRACHRGRTGAQSAWRAWSC